MKVMPFTPRRDAGIYLLELMVSITMMATVVLGLTTVLVVQAHQAARDKVLNDLYTYAELVLDEAGSAIGGGYEIRRGTNAGGTIREDLEFSLEGTNNVGRKLESHLLLEGDYKVIISQNGRRPPFIDQFPPPELDPNRHIDVRYRINVLDFSIHTYRDRLVVNPRISNILTEIDLVLELEDRVSDYKMQRVFRRIIATPNKHIAETRQLQSGQG